MPMAVGVIETLGFPAVLAAADAMVKSAAVTLVYYGQAESARLLVAVRGQVAEVRRAVEAGIAAGEEAYGGQVITHYIVSQSSGECGNHFAHPLYRNIRRIPCFLTKFAIKIRNEASYN